MRKLKNIAVRTLPPTHPHPHTHLPTHKPTSSLPNTHKPTSSLPHLLPTTYPPPTTSSPSTSPLLPPHIYSSVPTPSAPRGRPTLCRPRTRSTSPPPRHCASSRDQYVTWGTLLHLIVRGLMSRRRKSALSYGSEK